MTDTDHIVLTGEVINVQNGFIFVEVPAGDSVKTITCYPGGKLRKNSIVIIKGDIVDIKCSPYSLDKGIVTFRHRK